MAERRGARHPLQAPCLIILGFLTCGATLAHAGASGMHFWGPWKNGVLEMVAAKTPEAEGP